MDQLKVFWAVVVKFHFWILTVVVLLASLSSFYVSRQALDQEVITRIGAVEGKFRNVSTLNSQASSHPNDFSDEEMKKSVGLLTKDVKEAWESQYNRQRGILVWPQEVGTPETLKKLNQFRPIEFFLEYSNPPKPDPLDLTEREVYRDYVKNVFPKIAKIVGSTWTASLTPMSGGGGGGGGDSSYGAPVGAALTTDSVPLVIWETGSQSTLQKEIVPWFDPTIPPSTLEICYTQEDLWVLDGVLQVIKRTNGDARENFQAPIKKIDWIRLGQSASADAGDVQGVEALLAGPAVGINPYGGGTSFPGASPFGGGLGGAVPMRPDPLEGRYVDSDYKPVPASRLRSAMKSSAPADALFAVAKRIPVQFRVQMDPTKIASLISECGNNPLLIEVKQVRVNGKESAPGATRTFAVAGGGEGGDSGGGGGGSVEGGGGDSYGSGVAAFDTVSSSKSGDVPVEVYGIVYLLNPVDIQKLGLDKVKAETELDTTVEGSNSTPANPAVPATPAAPSDIDPDSGQPTPPASIVPAEVAPGVNNPPVSSNGKRSRAVPSSVAAANLGPIANLRIIRT